MTALAMPAGGTEHGAFRWGLSFAAVAAAHAAAGLWLLNSAPAADSGFLAGAAVVMLDLPQAPAPAPQFPVTDLPPGPEVPAVEQAPPPKEETKPPEQFTEVTLQEPEPPKPQQSVEATAPPPSIAIAVPDEKSPTAGSDVQPSPVAVRQWQNSLSAQLRRFLQRYPPKAFARGEQGSAAISLKIDSNGRVIESHITKSSGSRDLDEEMFALVARAQPLPKPPPDTKPADLEIIFAANFMDCTTCARQKKVR